MLIDTFVYGNISILNSYPEPKHYEDILTKLNNSMKDRSIDNIWNIIFNIKLMKDKELNLNLLRFVKRIFEIFDNYFTGNEQISKDNINILKSFLITEIKYSIICIQTFKHNDSMVLFFFENFHKEDIFCSENGIYFNYNIPNNDFWVPYWKVSYLDDTLELDFIDIYTDNLILFKKNGSKEKDYLDKVINRLIFLKKNTPDYFKNLKDNYLFDYTEKVFSDYHHSDIIKNYNKFSKITDNIFVPEILKDIEMNEVSLFMSLIPTRLLSYFLGLPYITGGSMPIRLLNNKLKLFLKDKKEFYKNVYENNNKFIEFKCITNKCGNAVDDEVFLNVLFTPVDTYNIDDIYVIVSNDTDYIFNFPEFSNILKTCSNPYNRQNISIYESYYMRHIMEMKNFIIRQGQKINLEIIFQGNMEEDFEATFEKAKKNYIIVPESYNNNQEMMNYVGPIITNFLNGRMI